MRNFRVSKISSEIGWVGPEKGTARSSNLAPYAPWPAHGRAMIFKSSYYDLWSPQMFSLQAYPSDGCCWFFSASDHWLISDHPRPVGSAHEITNWLQMDHSKCQQLSKLLGLAQKFVTPIDSACKKRGLNRYGQNMTKPSAFSLDSKFPRNHRFPHRFVNWNLLGSRQQLESSLVLPCCAGQLLRSRHCALQRLWLHQWPMQLGSQNEAIQD